MPKLIYLALLTILISKNLYSKTGNELKPVRINFLNDFVFPKNINFKNIKFGGISGLTFLDPETLLAVTDDRSKFGPARMYKLKIVQEKLSKNKNYFRLEIVNQIILKNEKQEPYKENAIDNESIILLKNNIYISSEGDNRKKPFILPAITTYSIGGNYKSKISPPKHFQFAKDSGIQFNLGFESLTTNKIDKIYVANEEPLKQDISSSQVRMLEYDIKNNELLLNNEYFIPIAPRPKDKNNFFDIGVNGLTELLYIAPKRFLGLERTYLLTNNQNFIKLYELSFSENNIAKRKLVFDFNTIIPKLSKEHKRLDNIEAMALGPIMSNGTRYLVFASDDNFSNRQRTVFYFFQFKNK